MNRIEDTICQAVEIITKKIVNQAGYDKTILAVIIDCIDETIGKYEVRYQDNIFYAFSNNIDITYVKGDSVYIQVPNNDFNKQKTIIGSTKRLGVNYIKTNPILYDINGKNILADGIFYSLNSYKKNQSITLYSKDKPDMPSIVDDKSAKEYLKNSNHLILEADFRTSLPRGQRCKGNYGMVFNLAFYNEINEKIIKSYILDVNNIVGNPYQLSKFTHQKVIFEIEGAKFIEIDSIILFSENFPKIAENKADDIFIKNISICGGSQVDPNLLNNSYLSFLTPQGIFFDKSSLDSDKINIETEVILNSKTVNPKAQNLKYYWYIEDLSIGINSPYYNNFGGKGWKCLNNKPGEGEWISAKNILTLTKKDVLTKENKYKCVVVNGNQSFSREITVLNYDAQYNITIDSSNGLEFYYGLGKTDLTCLINGENKNDFKFVWCSLDNNSLEILPNSSSILKNIEAKNINNFIIYKCGVYKDDFFLGTASITLKNSSAGKEEYSLILENAEKVFIYDEEGKSPTSQSIKNPIILSPLSFRLYDPKGNEIIENELRLWKITWRIPSDNSMLKPSKNDMLPNIVKNGKTFLTAFDLLQLNYDIDEYYNYNKNNNTIELEVKYKDIVLTQQTNFTFLKEGENGNNGSGFVCKIIPNSDQPLHIPFLIKENYDNRSSYDINYNVPNNKWLKLQLWHDNELIFNNAENAETAEGKIATVQWSILKNKYNSKISDNSLLSFDEVNNSFIKSNYFTTEPTADIIKATLSYQGNIIYTAFPVISAKVKLNYNIELKENSGFSTVIYSNSGQQPRYNTNSPFEIIVSENGKDISLSDSLEYRWSVVGNYYSSNTKDWINSNNLSIKNNYSAETKKNQVYLRPSNTYDGQCVTNSLVCTVLKNSNEIGIIKVPIYFMLNRYGYSDLNEWDGNSIELDENGGYLYSPQVGAGRKESDNSFTGLLMGKAKEASATKEKIGLLGYNHGRQSIFLDAETGKATFGVNDSGQIIIDPENNKAQIYSGDYSTLNKTGLMIDLTEPAIRYGNGNFSVDSSGHLVADDFSLGGGNFTYDSEAGKIKLKNVSIEWSNSTPPLATDIEGLQEQLDTKNTIFTRKPTKGYNEGDLLIPREAFTNNQVVFEAGKAYRAVESSESDFLSSHWREIDYTDDYQLNEMKKGLKYAVNDNVTSITGTTIYSPIISGGQLLIGNINSIYASIDTDGKLTCNGAEINGKITAASGNIAGWRITSQSLDSPLSSDNTGIVIQAGIGEIYGGEYDSTKKTWTKKWRLQKSGKAVFENIEAKTSGNIAGWEITSDSLVSSKTDLTKRIKLDSKNGKILVGATESSQNNIIIDSGGTLSNTGTLQKTILKDGALEFRYRTNTSNSFSAVGTLSMDNSVVSNVTGAVDRLKLQSNKNLTLTGNTMSIKTTGGTLAQSNSYTYGLEIKANSIINGHVLLSGSSGSGRGHLMNAYLEDCDVNSATQSHIADSINLPSNATIMGNNLQWFTMTYVYAYNSTGNHYNKLTVLAKKNSYVHDAAV